MNRRWRFCRPLPYHLAMPPQQCNTLLHTMWWSGRRDLNPRLQPWQGCTLPLSYSRVAKKVFTLLGLSCQAILAHFLHSFFLADSNLAQPCALTTANLLKQYAMPLSEQALHIRHRVEIAADNIDVTPLFFAGTGPLSCNGSAGRGFNADCTFRKSGWKSGGRRKAP